MLESYRSDPQKRAGYIRCFGDERAIEEIRASLRRLRKLGVEMPPEAFEGGPSKAGDG